MIWEQVSAKTHKIFALKYISASSDFLTRYMYRLHFFSFFQRHAPVTSTSLAFHDLKFLSSQKGLTSQWLSSSSCSDIPITFTSQSQISGIAICALEFVKNDPIS